VAAFVSGLRASLSRLQPPPVSIIALDVVRALGVTWWPPISVACGLGQQVLVGRASSISIGLIKGTVHAGKSASILLSIGKQTAARTRRSLADQLALILAARAVICIGDATLRSKRTVRTGLKCWHDEPRFPVLLGGSGGHHTGVGFHAWQVTAEMPPPSTSGEETEPDSSQRMGLLGCGRCRGGNDWNAVVFVRGE